MSAIHSEYRKSLRWRACLRLIPFFMPHGTNLMKVYRTNGSFFAQQMQMLWVEVFRDTGNIFGQVVIIWLGVARASPFPMNSINSRMNSKAFIQAPSWQSDLPQGLLTITFCTSSTFCRLVCFPSFARRLTRMAYLS
jgi:hypothetical protein